ncbi:MAG: response regulator [Verrucomicrobiia bacterium]|jgi:DNA-binding response OmpR family regulator
MSESKSSNGTEQPVTIFVVDDEPMLLDLAAAILKPLGYNVRTFSDPRVALEEFPVVRPAIVVTDYAMGEMNGLDLVRECRRANPRQKIILVSGTVDETIFAGLPQKPDRFMVKPYPVHELIETIRLLAAS